MNGIIVKNILKVVKNISQLYVRPINRAYI